MPSQTVLDDFVQSHIGHVGLCDLLEEIADKLPNQVNPGLYDAAMEMLKRDLALHRRDLEEGLFPLLLKRARPEDNIEASLEQLRVEHLTDDGSAHELLEMLPLLAAGDPMADPNVCGYMLRNFFECYRRHLSWELNLIVPLARKRLGLCDLEKLEALMRHHRQN